jgi:valyl-tRNA synthetase
VAVIYEKKVDVEAERERLTKEVKRLEGLVAGAQRQLGNEQFLSKAPPQVVEGLRKQAADNELLLQKARAALQKLG